MPSLRVPGILALLLCGVHEFLPFLRYHFEKSFEIRYHNEKENRSTYGDTEAGLPKGGRGRTGRDRGGGVGVRCRLKDGK
jgi:hypothetical protein